MPVLCYYILVRIFSYLIIHMNLPSDMLIKAASWMALLLCFCFTGRGLAQELDAEVTVDRSRINNTSLNYLNNFESELESYLNEYDWVDSHFAPHEQIGVDIQVTLMSADNNYNFEANIVIRSRRPIFNTVQQTPVFLFNDENWVFNYTPNRGFIHDELQFDALTSLFDFYAYIIIGFDTDTFSELGGNPYFSEAQNIVSLAQTSSSSSGWSRSANQRNRAQLAGDLLSSNYHGLRRAIYRYHRLGLDQFLDNPDDARDQILKALELIGETKQTAPNTLLFDIFFNAKYREIVSIFEDAPASIRLKAYNVLSRIDQSHLSAYEKLR